MERQGRKDGKNGQRGFVNKDGGWMEGRGVEWEKKKHEDISCTGTSSL